MPSPRHMKFGPWWRFLIVAKPAGRPFLTALSSREDSATLAGKSARGTSYPHDHLNEPFHHEYLPRAQLRLPSVSFENVPRRAVRQQSPEH
jgi:hypothetical protein